VSSKHRLAPSPELRRHWRLVRGLLVTLTAGVAVGSWWLMAAATPAKPPAKSVASHSARGAAATAPTPTNAATTFSGAIALTASGPGWLAPGFGPLGVARTDPDLGRRRRPGADH
jgi:hypothetical protein